MISTGIGNRIKELRKDKELSLDLMLWDFNMKFDTNINRGTLSKWENEINEPSLQYAKLLAEYYGVSLDYLIGLTDDKTPSRLLAYYKASKPRSRQKELV